LYKGVQLCPWSSGEARLRRKALKGGGARVEPWNKKTTASESLAGPKGKSQ